MSLKNTLKEKIEERKKVLDAANAILVKASTEKRSMTTEERSEFDKRHDTGSALLADIEAIEKQIDAERASRQPQTDTRTAGRDEVRTADTTATIAPEQRRKIEKESLRNWLAGGMTNLTEEQRSVCTLAGDLPAEVRALSAAIGASGAYTIPQGFQYDLDVALKSYEGVPEVADFIDTDAGNLLPFPTINDTANVGEQLAENTAATSAQDPTHGVINFSAYMLDSGIVLIPIQLLQDSAFDVEGYMMPLLTTRIGRKLNALATTGSGSSTIRGIVTAATTGVTTAANNAITYGEILDLEHSVDRAYRPKAKFMANDSVVRYIKGLLDKNDRPLFLAGGVSEGTSNRMPDRIDGFPLVYNQSMATTTSGVPVATSKAMLFGDFSKYKIRRVRGIQLVRFAERYMDLLQIGLMAFQRFDGNLVDAGTNPVKVMVIKT